ncbi:hypothetical protein Tco_1421370, partial [Tanacetum coccineum]
CILYIKEGIHVPLSVVVVTIVGVVMIVVFIGIVVVVGVSSIFKPSFVIIGISLGPVFLLELSAFAMAAAYASRAAEIPAISCRMASKVMAGVSDVDVLFGGILSLQENTQGYGMIHEDGDNDAK